MTGKVRSVASLTTTTNRCKTRTKEVLRVTHMMRPISFTRLISRRTSTSSAQSMGTKLTATKLREEREIAAKMSTSRKYESQKECRAKDLSASQIATMTSRVRTNFRGQIVLQAIVRARQCLTRGAWDRLTRVSTI